MKEYFILAVGVQVMAKYRTLFLVLMMPSIIFAQTLPSVSVLQSGIMLGTGRERHFSLRVEALGTDFDGIISDQITDLYRNPAFFDKIEHPLLFGELARPQYSYTPVVKVAKPVIRLESINQDSYPIYLVDPRSSTQLYYPENSSSPIGIRFGYTGRFGIFVRGNYASSYRQQNNQTIDSYPPYNQLTFSQGDWTMETRSDWGDAQFSYAFSLAEHVSAGVSYTFGISENPNKAQSRNVSFRSLINPYYTDSTYSANRGFSNLTNRTTSHTIRSGLLWDREGIMIDALGTLEFISADLSIDQHSEQAYHDVSRSLRSPQYSISDRYTIQDFITSAGMKGTNIRIDTRYLNASDQTQSFTAQLGQASLSFLLTISIDFSVWHPATMKITMTRATLSHTHRTQSLAHQMGLASR